MATKKISELSTYTESSISDATQALVPLDDLTVVGTGKTKHMSFAEQAKWFGANLPKLVVNSGTLTASTPFTFSQTWNNVAVSFRGVKIAVTNSASAATSLPFEVLGGAGGVTNLLSARTDGVVQAGTEVRSPVFSTRSDSGEYRLGASDDLSLVRVAADHLGVRRGANAQSLSIFNNYVSASVYERGRFGWAGSVLEIGTEHAGGTNRGLALKTNGTNRMVFHSSGLGIQLADNEYFETTGSPNNYFQIGTTHYGFASIGNLRFNIDSDNNSTANYFIFGKDSGSFSGSATELMRLTEAGLLTFGGIASSQPAIKPSGTSLQIKLADDSALTGLEAKTLTATGGTLTASAPSLNVTQTWNNAAVTFEGSKTVITDTASAAGSLPWQVLGGAAGTTNLVSVNKSGLLTLGTNLSHGFNGRSGAALCAYFNGTNSVDMQAGGLTLRSTGQLFWSATDDAGGVTDVKLLREAANHLALRNSTNAQSFSVYGSYTSGSVYNRLRIYSDSSNYNIAAEHVGDSYKGFQVLTNGTVGLAVLSGNVYTGSSFVVASAGSVIWNGKGAISQASDGIFLFNNGGGVGGVLQLTENTAPSAPSANNVRIFAEDNGAGKTRLMAIFPSGAAQQIAIEP